MLYLYIIRIGPRVTDIRTYRVYFYRNDLRIYRGRKSLPADKNIRVTE